VATWKQVIEIGTLLPETAVDVWYGKPALKIADKGFLHLGEGDQDLSFPSDEKQDLLASRPDAYWSKPHHDGTPWLFVRLAKISKAELRELLTDAWRLKAPPKVRRAHPEV
jgi:hypothetical protein